VVHELEAICQILNEQQYKLTPQRKVILKALLNHSNDHLSAEELYEIVKRQNPDIGLATVYRTLDLLAELDILQKMNFGDGRSRYEFNTQDIHHHHHLICTSCGKVTEFDDDLLESLESMIQRRTGFDINDHDLKFYGVCKDCSGQDVNPTTGYPRKTTVHKTR